MDLTELLSALSGESTYRTRSGLPESEDIMSALVPAVTEDLLKKAAQKLLSGKLLGNE